MNPLQKGSRDIHSNQGYSVMVQFLQSVDATAAATLALRCIDHLPSLIVTLLYAISGIVKIKEHSNEDRKATEIFDDLNKRPSTQCKRYPFPNPFERKEGHSPRRDLQLAFVPGQWSLARLAKNDHRFSF